LIGILDIAIGNLRSIANAIYELGFDYRIIEDLYDSDDLTHLVLPGVGKFSTAARHLRERGLENAIRCYAESGRPLLGICLGMQLLAHLGTEGGSRRGLGLVEGTVRKLPDDTGLRVPHVGWNTLSICRAHPALEGLKASRDTYYVHSFYLDANQEDVFAHTDFGGPIPAVVGVENVLGYQFHPEKSQATGLKLLENFCHWNGRC